MTDKLRPLPKPVGKASAFGAFFLFVLLGPFFGALPIAVLALAVAVVEKGVFEAVLWLPVLALSLAVFAYMVGLIPAVISGAWFAIRLRRGRPPDLASTVVVGLLSWIPLWVVSAGALALLSPLSILSSALTRIAVLRLVGQETHDGART